MGIVSCQPVHFLLLSRLMRWERCFWNAEEGVMSCWSWGPTPALDNQCTIKKKHFINFRFPRRYVGTQGLQFYEFLCNASEVLRKAALVCDGGAMSWAESGAGAGDSWRQLAAAGGHSTELTLPRLPHAHELTRLSESKQHSSSLSSPQAHCEVFKTATAAGTSTPLISFPIIYITYIYNI